MVDESFRSSDAVDRHVHLLIIIAGLVLWVIGTNIHDVHFIGVNLGESISHLGFLVAVIVALHWIFEARIRQNLVRDVVAWVVGSQRIAESGIIDYVENSRKIDYADELRKSKNVTVCVHYSPRFLEDNFSVLAARKNRNQSLIVITLKEDCESLEYLLVARKEADHIKPNMRKIRTLVGQLKEAGANITLIEHDSILRYSFVKLDDSIWIKFYRNSLGLAEIPAIRVRSGTRLFEFFETDISTLIERGG